MKLYLPLLASVLAFASCSTAYKTGQTPDDVYYSPERAREARNEERDEYARVEKRDDRYYRNEETAREERFLRMRTGYRRYALLDDCDCYCYNGGNYYGFNNPYRFNNWGLYSNPWNSPWNYSWNYNPYLYSPYSFGSGFYNPYFNRPYTSGYAINNGRAVYNRPRTGTAYATNGDGDSYYQYKGNNGRSGRGAENYNNSGRNAGSFMRNTFGSEGSSGNSGSGSRSSSSSSGGAPTSAPVRKF